jgi:cobalt/nickel transport system permease protein
MHSVRVSKVGFELHRPEELSMHIPDSVLSPATSAACGAAMLPVWAMAARQVRQRLQTRQAPLLALGAAFCFTIMMFNIPALGGTTAHPVAGTLLAVLLGPWAAVIGISVALAIQALFFGDGGLLAFGANCFTMAFVLPFVGYSVYRLLSARMKSTAPARAFCAAVGSYVGIVAASGIVALLLGIQPALFHEPNGHALYFPFGLNITLPAMLGTHLLIAGPAEAVVTGLVVAYMLAAKMPLYGQAAAEQAHRARGRREVLWVGLLAMMALSPLGLLAKGDAWGEWDTAGIKAQIKKVEGREYVPQGMAQSEAHGYQGLRGLNDYASDKGWKGYLGAGALGVGSIVALILVGGRLLARREKDEDDRDPDPPGSRPRVETPSTDALPDWLSRPSDATSPPATLSGRPPNRYLERSLGELASGAATALLGERSAHRPGYLQQLDPRAKVVGLFALIVVTGFVHALVPLVALYLLTLGLAMASHLPIGALVRRVWLSVPVAVGAITLPAALNVVTPGREALTLWHAHPHLAITWPGMALAGLLTLRVGVAISLATLLTLTTPWNDLLRALRALFVPRLFVSVLAMTYRYLTVLLQTAGEMFTARRSRTLGRATNAEGRQFVGRSIGTLFGKTLTLSEEVHAAMIARGFQGDMPTLTRLRWRAADSLWALAVVITASLMLGARGR